MCIISFKTVVRAKRLFMFYQHQKTRIATFLAFWKTFELFLRIRPKYWPEPDIRSHTGKNLWEGLYPGYPGTLVTSLTPSSLETVCSICGVLMSLKGLQLHIRTVHLKQRPFTCQYCGKSFGQKITMTRHIDRYHP